ncbi:MAG: methylated-DNA--[protein]-cysteine S-methyltransferase [Candidatus Nanohaloarchaea archaeon]|nr:methylated-DNA--[protein]-cysteine S-methyltransferase [Candidatus Nanohaloarchaea archaeon]
MELELRSGAVVLEEERIQGDVRDKLEDYLDGERVEFDEEVDLEDLAPFYEEVLQKVRGVGYGETRTYGEVAEEIGNPEAARAVANALNANPVPIVIPCHRVVAEDGIGGYKHGKEAKRNLLELEGSLEE